MLKGKNRLVRIIGLFVSVFALTIISLHLINGLSKTTKFQLFGELVTHVDTQEKVVALTYDDGPNPPYTKQLSDIFDRHQIKATFFVVGKMLEKHPETAQLLLSKGHELGNHSYSHKHMLFKSPSFIRSELEKTDQLLRQLGVKQDIHFRAPYGRKLVVLPYFLAKMHKKNILWNIAPEDYDAISSEAIENYVLERVIPGSIVCMHDGGGDRSRTVAATEMLIKKLQGKGYTFTTVSELIAKGRKQRAEGRRFIASTRPF